MKHKQKYELLNIMRSKINKWRQISFLAFMHTQYTFLSLSLSLFHSQQYGIHANVKAECETTYRLCMRKSYVLPYSICGTGTRQDKWKKNHSIHSMPNIYRRKKTFSGLFLDEYRLVVEIFYMLQPKYYTLFVALCKRHSDIKIYNKKKTFLSVFFSLFLLLYFGFVLREYVRYVSYSTDIFAT